MVGASGIAGCDVLLHLTSDIVWVYPPQTPNTPSQDKTLDGVVEIECPVGGMTHGRAIV